MKAAHAYDTHLWWFTTDMNASSESLAACPQDGQSGFELYTRKISSVLNKRGYNK